MSQDIYGLCCRHHGKIVRISCRDGRVHVGRISRVTPNRVYIDPIGPNIGGYGYGYGGYGYGFRRRGFGVGIALGVITGVALSGLFFW
jgi:hypothetical protein